MPNFFDRLASLTLAPFRLEEWAVLLAFAVVVVGGCLWVVGEILRRRG